MDMMIINIILVTPLQHCFLLFLLFSDTEDDEDDTKNDRNKLEF